MRPINSSFILFLQNSGFTPQGKDRFLCFLVRRLGQENACQHDHLEVRRKLLPVKPIDFLHESARPISREGVADLFRRHKAEAGLLSAALHHITKPCPVAETFTGSVNPTVIPVLSDAGILRELIAHPLPAYVLIRHLIPFCPLLFFSSEQYGLLLFSYERGNRGSVFSNGCSAGMSSLPCINTSLHRFVLFSCTITE